ncbi:MAG TPA: hypothetical protein VFG33_32840 [Kribbella sp.]|uniref:hypothetical protein n=1 Tax=Kribbella sp. TaxID=1871183 RepID=UPI002D776E85|nr:hypothetical protein [Kribbella sp.]HET6298210.1 hypothetical protein [Kribbella sp.]
MNDVKSLLEEFADRAVAGLPPADVDADVVRGRRALRRIRARRRVTGVLCIAAASAAVLVVGNQAKWWDKGEAEVATDSPDADAQTGQTPTAAASSAPSDDTMSLYSGSALALVANGQAWSTIDCKLAPEGWTPETPVTADRVVLTPPSVRTSDTDAKLELSAADESQSLTAVRAIGSGATVVHVGQASGRQVGQIKLGERWLVVKLPVDVQQWTDDVVARFLESCTVS